MPTRLDHPLMKLAQFKGPIAIGRFDDGTLLVAGPMDEPILIRDGCVMRLNSDATTKEADGDMVFSYESVLRVPAPDPPTPLWIWAR